MEGQRYRDGWTMIGSDGAEYAKTRYLDIGPWWIGFSIRWCELESGRILPSRYRHGSGGPNGVKHYYWWYFHITIYRSRLSWLRLPKLVNMDKPRKKI